MAYEVVMPYHLHMPSYFLETFTEYPKTCGKNNKHSSPQNAYSTNFNSLIKRVDFPYFSII